MNKLGTLGCPGVARNVRMGPQFDPLGPDKLCRRLSPEDIEGGGIESNRQKRSESHSESPPIDAFVCGSGPWSSLKMVSEFFTIRSSLPAKFFSVNRTERKGRTFVKNLCFCIEVMCKCLFDAVRIRDIKGGISV